MGPFPVEARELNFLILAVNYFTKWVEAEAVARITAKRVHRFYWRNIIFRFGLRGVIVSYDGTQFSSSSIIEFCKGLGIKNQYILVERL